MLFVSLLLAGSIEALRIKNVEGKNSYKAAYVEHQATSACGSGSCGKRTLAQNVQAYAQYAATAASQGAQIIVFPEYGITGFSSYPKSSWISGGYTEQIPSRTSSSVVPCDSPGQFPDAASVVSLSCAAKARGIAIVANLVEHAGTNVYNTNVAIDTDGTYLGKYRKQNLWGETNMDIPQDCPEASFTTSFGVTFGLLTCADLIYTQPALTLLRKKNISDFVLPAAWSDEMAQMQVLGYAQGWSFAYGVNLILCNQRTSSMSGSGIFQSGVDVKYTFATSGRAKVEVAQVGGDTAALATTTSGMSDTAALATFKPSATAPPLFGTRRKNSTMGVDKKSSGWSFAALSEGKVRTATPGHHL
jgi:predicted amidohydrolase